jgi:hypothetical protein
MLDFKGLIAQTVKIDRDGGDTPIMAFCVGLPGWINKRVTLCCLAQVAKAFDRSSGPLSQRIAFG